MTAVLEAREARRAVARWWGVALEEYGAVAPYLTSWGAFAVIALGLAFRYGTPESAAWVSRAVTALTLGVVSVVAWARYRVRRAGVAP